MVASIVSPAGVLLDDDPFRVPRTAAYFWIYIVLAIAALGKATFAILKRTSSDIAWQGFTVPGLESCQKIMRLLQGCLFMLDVWSRRRSVCGRRRRG